MAGMISSIVPQAVGNAVRLWLQPPANARLWRILRREDDNFSSANDPGARKVYEGAAKSVVDFEFLENGTEYWYQVFYYNGSAWSAGGAAVSETPAATYEDRSVDALEVVLHRLQAGVRAEVARGKLHPQDPSHDIKVFSAPPAWESISWPLFTVHLQTETPEIRSLGEITTTDAIDELTEQWDDLEGWYAKSTLNIIGWSQNPDERIELRKTLRRILVANLGVLDAAGLARVEFQLQDLDSVGGEYPTCVYQAMCTLTCLTPVRVVTERSVPISDVTVEIDEVQTQG